MRFACGRQWDRFSRTLYPCERTQLAEGPGNARPRLPMRRFTAFTIACLPLLFVTAERAEHARVSLHALAWLLGRRREYFPLPPVETPRWVPWPSCRPSRLSRAPRSRPLFRSTTCRSGRGPSSSRSRRVCLPARVRRSSLPMAVNASSGAQRSRLPGAGKRYRGPERASPHRHSCLARAISDAQSALDGSLAGGCRGVRSSVRWRSRGRPSTSPCRPGGRPRDSAHEFDASSGSERLARALSSPSRARQKSTGNYRLYLPRGPA